MVGQHERKVVTEVLRANIFELAVRYIESAGAAIDPDDLLHGLEGLAAIIQSEEFFTQKVREQGKHLPVNDPSF
jgi:hypothetical protein